MKFELFNEGEDVSEEVVERRRTAIDELVEAIRQIADRNEVCPVCLLMVVAEGVERDHEETSALTHHMETIQ